MTNQPAEIKIDPMSQLYSAMVELQKVIQDPEKTETAKAGTFDFKYADLANILKMLRKDMSELDLSLMQPTKVIDQQLVLITRIAHVSGGFLESEYPVCSINEKPQVKGASLTYARRYALSSMIGISAVDDKDYQGANGNRLPSGRAKEVINFNFLQQEIHEADHKKLDRLDDRYREEMNFLPLKWVLALKEKIEHRRQELDKIDYGENGELLFKDDAAE